MDSERWERIQTLFMAALERSDDERAVFLDEACAGDPGLRRELETMLGAHEQSHALAIENRLLTDEPDMLPSPSSTPASDPTASKS